MIYVYDLSVRNIQLEQMASANVNLTLSLAIHIALKTENLLPMVIDILILDGNSCMDFFDIIIVSAQECYFSFKWYWFSSTCVP